MLAPSVPPSSLSAGLALVVPPDCRTHHSEAAFASLAGASPIPASSGNTKRQRLNRGGDRQLNQALHNVTLVRMRIDVDTKAYVEKRIKEGTSKREIMRCLKRYLARTIHRTLTTEQPTMLNPKSLKTPLGTSRSIRVPETVPIEG